MKTLKSIGLAGKEFKKYIDAVNHTYVTRKQENPPTPLLFFDNPNKQQIIEAENILEVGCGVGRNLSYILVHNKAKYYGIDPNKTMLKYFWDFNKLYKENKDNRVFLYEDFIKLSNIKFDIVLITFVFQHIGYRVKNDEMNVDDITQKIMDFTQQNTIWFMLEHELEEPKWFEKWYSNVEDKLEITFQKQNTNILPNLKDHTLTIFKQRY